MRIDHLVINIDKQYQTDSLQINDIKDTGLLYEPAWGKGTSGFKAYNIWIGDEYFEMIRLKNKSGGGWRKDWVEKYNNNHRGLICLFIDTNDIKAEYDRLEKLNIKITEPEYLKFKWFFNLLTRTMPWQNSYLPYFEGAPFQIGFQQMKDEASLNWMRQYMVPNSRDNGIDRIVSIRFYANYTENDKQLIKNIFKSCVIENNEIIVELDNSQRLHFIQDKTYHVEVFTQCNEEKYKNKNIKIHNIEVKNV
jgi:hypothetical protein